MNPHCRAKKRSLKFSIFRDKIGFGTRVGHFKHVEKTLHFPKRGFFRKHFVFPLTRTSFQHRDWHFNAERTPETITYHRNSDCRSFRQELDNFAVDPRPFQRRREGVTCVFTTRFCDVVHPIFSQTDVDLVQTSFNWAHNIATLRVAPFDRERLLLPDAFPRDEQLRGAF